MSTSPPIAYPAFELCGVAIHAISRLQIQQWILSKANSKCPATAMYVNAHAINLAQSDDAFRTALRQADIVFCDGFGVRLGAKLLGYPLPERFTLPDWIEDLARLFAQNQYSMFFLGGRPGVAEQAKCKLEHLVPNLQIEAQHGYFESDETEAIVARINAARPQLLLVGMGMPMQELWVQANAHLLTAHVIITVGALFDYMAGAVPRGPRWLTDHGLEWLSRLWFEPKRLWRRYILGNPQFVWLVAKQWIRQKSAR